MKKQTILIKKTLLGLSLTLVLNFTAICQKLNFDNFNSAVTIANYTQLAITIPPPDNCTDPTYWIGPNMNSACSSFPNRRGNQNFLTINANDTSVATITTTFQMTAGNYLLNFRSVHRFIPTNTQTQNLNVETGDILVGATVVGHFTIPLQDHNWAASGNINFTIPNGVTGLFAMRINSDHGIYTDFSIDDIEINSCVLPTIQSITCDNNGKPIIRFCLRNIGAVPAQFFMVELPPNIPMTNLPTAGGVSLLCANPQTGMYLFRSNSPVLPNQLACFIRFRVEGRVYKGQQLCLNVKSFQDFNCGLFTGLGCCANSAPVCFTIPDCPDDCADIVESGIICQANGQRILNFRVINRSNSPMAGLRNSTVNGTAADNYFSYFSPVLQPGQTSQMMSHILPNNIIQGSTYCFTSTAFLNSVNGPNCDSCFADTVCLKVPNCSTTPTCLAPTVLGCRSIAVLSPFTTELFWNSQPGVTSYILNITLNDPACCPINNPIDRPAIYLTTNSWPINIIESCFSWKITSVCGDVIGEISEKACHAANMDCGPVGDFETPQNKKEEEEKDEVLIDQGVKIYPNPVTDDKLMFSLGNVLVSDKIRIEIYSIDGRKILSKDFIGNSEDQINISTLTSGLYIVRVLQNNHQIHTDKFEKQ